MMIDSSPEDPSHQQSVSNVDVARVVGFKVHNLIPSTRELGLVWRSEPRNDCDNNESAPTVLESLRLGVRSAPLMVL